MKLCIKTGGARILLSLAMTTCAGGCASVGGLGRGTLDGAGTAALAGPVRVGAARLVDAAVNPMVPLHLSNENGTIAVRFGEERAGVRSETVVLLDAESLDLVDRQLVAALEDPRGPARGASRTPLGHGRFITCWRQGDADTGYRVMAQAWTQSGMSMGSPVAISPANEDALGSPQIVSLADGQAVATFETTDGEHTELLAVPIEVL
jgi:hypothetical protein